MCASVAHIPQCFQGVKTHVARNDDTQPQSGDLSEPEATPLPPLSDTHVSRARDSPQAQHRGAMMAHLLSPLDREDCV